MYARILAGLAVFTLAAGAAQAQSTTTTTTTKTTTAAKSSSAKSDAAPKAKSSAKGGGGTYASPKHALPYSDVDAYLKDSAKMRAEHGW